MYCVRKVFHNALDPPITRKMVLKNFTVNMLLFNSKKMYLYIYIKNNVKIKKIVICHIKYLILRTLVDTVWYDPRQ